MNEGKIKTTLIVIISILILAGAAYWYFFMFLQTPTTNQPATNDGPGGFQPINRPGTGGTGSTDTVDNGVIFATSTTSATPGKIPTLRLLSSTPVGGYGASTTASTTVIRWIDRGRGNVYEARGDTLDITTLSNTIVPMMYKSNWNKNLTSFIGSMFRSNQDSISTVYTSLVPQNIAAGTSSSQNISSVAPFQLKGKNLPESVADYAVSPKKDRVFMFSVDGGKGIGYIAPFNGGAAVEIFETPLTQVNIDWPEESTIAITTKGVSDQGGFLYFVDPKTGKWTKILGPLPGLSATVSHDAKYALVSVSGNNTVLTSMYSIDKHKGVNALVSTMADKCAWGNFYKDIVYCAAPSQPVSGKYPDDWYTGKISTVDKIWQIKADTGEVHLVSSIVDQSDRVIDAFGLGLDPKDNFLFFMNKNDLSLWSLDLVSSQ